MFLNLADLTKDDMDAESTAIDSFSLEEKQVQDEDDFDGLEVSDNDNQESLGQWILLEKTLPLLDY